MKTKLIYLVLLFLSANSNAQSVNDILSNVYKQYSAKEALQFDTSYDLYKTFEATAKHQSYTGKFYKNEAHEVYMKIDNTEMLSNKEVNLKISHSEKAILIDFPDLKVSEEYNMSELLKVYKAGDLKDNKTYWEIELLANHIGLPYTKIILHISKDFLLKKQTFLYADAINFSENFRKSDIHSPRLEVIYSNYSRESIVENKFKTSNFLEFKNNKPLVSSKDLKGYELLDNRVSAQ